MKVSMYKKGSEIRTLNRLLQLIVDENRYVYFNDRPVHPKFIMQWPLVDIYNRLLQGRLHHAEPNEEFIMYEVWEEGYAATGQHAPAGLIGRARARSFREACDRLCSKRAAYDSERLTIWGCRLFDNEADARRSFG